MGKLFQLFDRYPAIPLSMLGTLLLAVVTRKGKRVKRKIYRGKGLDEVLFVWPDGDTFTVRNLLDGGVAIFGRSGSGKTTGSGYFLLRKIVANRYSGGLILAAKNSDVEEIARLFKPCGRDDLLVFSSQNPHRFNFLRWLGKHEPRNIVQCMMMVAETLHRGERGGEDGVLWLCFLALRRAQTFWLMRKGVVIHSQYDGGYRKDNERWIKLFREPLVIGILGLVLRAAYLDQGWPTSGLPLFFLTGVFTLPFVEITKQQIWQPRVQGMANARFEQQAAMEEFTNRYGR